MPRVPRCQLNDGVFHATARAVFGAQLFDDDLDRVYFLHLLRSTGALFDWRLHAHCLMGTHYHVILSATRDRLSDGMRRLARLRRLRAVDIGDAEWYDLDTPEAFHDAETGNLVYAA